MHGQSGQLRIPPPQRFRQYETDVPVQRHQQPSVVVVNDVIGDIVTIYASMSIACFEQLRPEIGELAAKPAENLSLTSRRMRVNRSCVFPQ